jgi:hypothetical protein
MFGSNLAMRTFRKWGVLGYQAVHEPAQATPERQEYPLASNPRTTDQDLTVEATPEQKSARYLANMLVEIEGSSPERKAQIERALVKKFTTGEIQHNQVWLREVTLLRSHAKDIGVPMEQLVTQWIENNLGLKPGLVVAGKGSNGAQIRRQIHGPSQGFSR